MYRARNLEATGFETLSVAGTSVGITATLIDSTECYAFLGPVEAGDIRYRVDGGDPTATVGHLLPVGATKVLEEQDSLLNFRAIRVSGTASVPITVYR